MAREPTPNRNQYQTKKALAAVTNYKCCVICGETRDIVLDAAHLDQSPTNNDPDNLAWLCKCHHRMVDDKLYPVEIVKLMRAEWNRHKGVGDPKNWVKDAGRKSANARSRSRGARKAWATRRAAAASATS